MAVKAYGRMVFWEGASLWVLGTRAGEGPYPRTDFHSHHAVQVTLSLRGEIAIEHREGRVPGNAIAIAADTEHAFRGEGVVVHLFIDPEGRAGRNIARTLLTTEPMVAIPAALIGDLPAQLLATFENPQRTDASLIALGRTLVAQLAQQGAVDARPEIRVRKMIAWATAQLEGPIALADVAKHLGLSSGRARHLFVAQTGMPFRTYLLWLRLMKAVEVFASGHALTDAAHAAGFSDSAHLSRTFRRMFGIAADSLRVV